MRRFLRSWHTTLPSNIRASVRRTTSSRLFGNVSNASKFNGPGPATLALPLSAFFGAGTLSFWYYAHTNVVHAASDASFTAEGGDSIIDPDEPDAGTPEQWDHPLDTFVRRMFPVDESATSLATAIQKLRDQEESHTFSTGQHIHACQYASNYICEDAYTIGRFGTTSQPGEWYYWAIFDGHAGHATSHLLARAFSPFMAQGLNEFISPSRPYFPDDEEVHSRISEGFTALDAAIKLAAALALRDYPPADARAIRMMAPALSGSCALSAFFDPAHSVLRIANIGDSRAVLGRFDDAKGAYVAHPLSTDHTGFNAGEVSRIRDEHPGEPDVIDPKTGRLLGIAVTRAIGDVRWKWNDDEVSDLHKRFWGHKPRPAGVNKTPPYLSAKPEITETVVRNGARGDFLIMASDGFWDLVGNEVAVEMVERWIEGKRKNIFLQRQGRDAGLEQRFDRPDDNMDTYYDEKEGLRWHVKPEHIVVEDDNAATHLIKNAFGGKRRNLFTGVMSIYPPLSRDVRDDVTVQVVFFGGI